MPLGPRDKLRDWSERASRFSSRAPTNGCSWSTNTGVQGTKLGLPDVLQLVRNNMYDLDITTRAVAAEEGSLAMLELARENDRPWDKAE